MSAPRMSTRVTRAMALVAILSALLLSVASSLAARFVWRAREERELALAADALAAAIDREAREEGLGLAVAVAEALRESTLPGYRAEVWRGPDLVASSARADGAPAPGSPAAPGWLRHTRPLPEGLTLVLSEPPDQRGRALGVFAWSLLLAAPACLLIAVLVGRAVAARATRPLRDLQQRIALAHGLTPLPASALDDVPVEVGELEAAFRALWARQQEMLRRESEFAANASHELRTPLTRIRLLAERALDGGPTARAALEAQTEEVDRLTRLVDSLLVLARDAAAGIPHGEAVNLADVCRRVAARAPLDARATDGHFPDEALVRGDDALIEIAVENLLDNARKFASGDAPIGAALTGADGTFRLEVTTPGARVKGQERERLFERFHRGAEARGQVNGHGLGLALARHIARLHGGDVACVSDEAEDARFALTLPVWAEQHTRGGG